MKTLVSRETDDFFSALSELTESPTDGADIYLEVNPTTMI